MFFFYGQLDHGIKHLAITTTCNRGNPEKIVFSVTIFASVFYCHYNHGYTYEVTPAVSRPKKIGKVCCCEQYSLRNATQLSRQCYHETIFFPAMYLNNNCKLFLYTSTVPVFSSESHLINSGTLSVVQHVAEKGAFSKISPLCLLFHCLISNKTNQNTKLYSGYYSKQKK